MFGLPSEDAWSRVQKTVREVEKELRSGGNDPPVTVMPGHIRCYVLITGPAEAMTTTTSSTTTSTTTTTGTETTSTTTSTTTSSTSTSSTTSSSTTSATSTTPANQVYCYPAVLVTRDLRFIMTDKEWFKTSVEVWAQDLNDEPLELGHRYVGDSVEWYNGRPLVIVTSKLSETAPLNNVRVVRTLLNSSQDPGNPGANYVTDAGTGGIYYLSLIEGWSQGDLYFDIPGYVWMSPFYQPAMVGACSLPPVGYGWPCIDSGVQVTLYADPVDGPPDGDGHPTSNPRFLTLEVWEQADPLPRLGCDDSGNPFIVIP